MNFIEKIKSIFNRNSNSTLPELKETSSCASRWSSAGIRRSRMKRWSVGSNRSKDSASSAMKRLRISGVEKQVGAC